MTGPESREQANIVKLFDALGFVVISTSEARSAWRASGLPDLWVTHPELGLCFWWEVKGPKGRLSATQEAFIALTEAAARNGGENTVPRCYVGTYADAERLVVRLGLADPDDRDGSLVFLRPKKGDAYHAWHTAQRLRRLGTRAKRAQAKPKAGAPRSRLETVHPLMRKDIADWLAKGVPQRDIMKHFRVSRYAVQAFAADLKRAA
jgi:hypothetical protein